MIKKNAIKTAPHRPSQSRLMRELTTLSLILFFWLAGCGNSANKLSEIDTGSRLNLRSGEITDSSLEFVFKPSSKKTNRDLFNYIYFEGDNICFSFTFPQKMKPSSVKVWFADKITGKKYPAERIDIKENIVFGHSLTGSLLESFLGHKLDEEVPSDKHQDKKFIFTVFAEVKEGEKILTTEKTGEFTIRFE